MTTYSALRQQLSAVLTEADLLAALGAGWLQESHYLDFKRDPWKPRSDEMLKDLGAMAFDGGFIVLGVDEGPPAAGAPFAIKGIREQIVQTAQQLSPPLRVSTTEIASSVAGDGFIVVEIPPSASLVHYLNSGRAPWREDTTTRWLTADEQNHLDKSRRDAEAEIITRLTAGIPVHPEPQASGHLAANFRIVARPLFPTPRLLVAELQDAADSIQASGFLGRTLDQAAQAQSMARSALAAPDPLSLGSFQEDWQDEGPTYSPTASGTRVERRNSSVGYQQVALEADGTLRVHFHNIARHLKYPDGNSTKVVDDQAAIVLIRETIEVLRTIIDRSHYRGPWWIGLRMTGLSGCFPASLQPTETDPMGRTSRRGYAVENLNHDYLRVLPVTAQAIEEDREAITEDLMGDLLHQMGAKPRWKKNGYLRD